MACVRKRRDRWVIDFYDQEGVRRWKTMPKGTTKNEVNEELGKIEKKVRQGGYTPVRELPNFSKVADSWLSSKKPDIRHSTYHGYKGHIKNHLNPYFKRVKINHVNFEVIEKFKKHCLDTGVRIATLRKILITLGAVLTYAVRMRYIDFNPCREVEKPKGQSAHSNKEEMVILQPDELQALFDAGANQKERLLFMTATLTGMRQGELLGLQWGDMDWHNYQVHVRRTFNHGQFYEPKSKASRRKIDMPPELVSELKHWKLACPISELDLVFPSQVGTPQDATNMLRRQFFPALRRAGLPKIRFHDLRHTYASLLIDQGEYPKYIQTQLGHSSINMTMDIYGHLMRGVNRKAGSRLGRAVLGNSKSNGSKMVAEQGRATELESVNG